MKWIWNIDTGERFRDKWEASRKLGISAEHVRRLSQGIRTSANYHLTVVDDGRPESVDIIPHEKEQKQPRSVDTLCGVCGNYFCTWIQHLQPVEGWDADEVPTNNSYLVRTCPLYQENPRRRKEKE